MSNEKHPREEASQNEGTEGERDNGPLKRERDLAEQRLARIRPRESKERAEAVEEVEEERTLLPEVHPETKDEDEAQLDPGFRQERMHELSGQAATGDAT